MPLRRERRRRLLSDEPLESACADQDANLIRFVETPPLRAAGPVAYATTARRDCQRRVLDLLPQRPLAVALFLTFALLAVGLVEVLHVVCQTATSLVRIEDLAALRLDAARNISHWLSSLLLGLAALVALLVYSLRRHRVDDYHGRYRVWLWTAAACLFVSMAEATDAVLLLRGICRRMAEACAVSDRIVWPILVTAVLSGAGVRLFLEVRRCRWAASALAASAASVLLAAAVEHGWLIEVADEHRLLAARGSWLVSYVCLLAAFVLYARRVLGEIEGLVVSAPAGRRRAKAQPAAGRAPESRPAEPSQKPSLQLRTDLDPVEKLPAASPAARPQTDAGPVRPAAGAASAATIGMNSGRHLSRAERRRIRRESRMAG